ncbi:MAG: putative manganese transporter [Gemmatimonadota bacterium]|jgi:hypothetical protein
MIVEAVGALRDSVMITAFVAVMMIAVEYLNVLTRGTFESAFRGAPALQYLAAIVLGAIPGCLGAFTVVALYSHRVITVGAVVGAMIATSGDEAFVLLALVPRTALWLTLGLAGLGLVVAPLVDAVAGERRHAPEPCPRLSVHDEECRCLPGLEVLTQWTRPTPHRVLLLVGTAGFLLWVMAGGPGAPPTWTWVRTTLAIAAAFGTFVVVTVPDHFLDEHLWGHVVHHHVPRIFVWTGGVLVGIAVLHQMVDLGSVVQANAWALLVLAALMGLIPESGPHLVFVTLFAAGDLPASVLVASSVVQDGHGMLPLLAQSRADFVRVKLVNLLVGLAVGAAMLLAGR